MKKHEFEPFERVLVREEDSRIWRIDFFNSMRDELYVCLAGAWHQCVPYEGNEHLLSTTDNPVPPEREYKFGDKVYAQWCGVIYKAIVINADKDKCEVAVDMNNGVGIQMVFPYTKIGHANW